MIIISDETEETEGQSKSTMTSRILSGGKAIKIAQHVKHVAMLYLETFRLTAAICLVSFAPPCTGRHKQLTRDELKFDQQCLSVVRRQRRRCHGTRVSAVERQSRR